MKQAILLTALFFALFGIDAEAKDSKFDRSVVSIETVKPVNEKNPVEQTSHYECFGSVYYSFDTDNSGEKFFGKGETMNQAIAASGVHKLIGKRCDKVLSYSNSLVGGIIKGQCDLIQVKEAGAFNYTTRETVYTDNDEFHCQNLK